MASSIARMNLFLHGIVDFDIERGNTLSEPKFLEGDRLQQFDFVLANPPYSIKQWDRKLWATDPYGRNRFGTPPQGRADYAFFQHILASMKSGPGRCAILFPHGVLFRDEEREMRKRIIEADLIDCVLGLGPGLFYNSPMEACVVFCSTDKPTDRKGQVLFIDASALYVRQQAQSFLEHHHITRIVDTYRHGVDVPEFARVAPTEEVLANDAKLSLQLYVAGTAEADVDTGVPVNTVVAAWLARRERPAAQAPARGGAAGALNAHRHPQPDPAAHRFLKQSRQVNPSHPENRFRRRLRSEAPGTWSPRPTRARRDEG